MIAARFYGRQPRHIAAVTGTSGKTSTASFVRQLWTALGRKAASIGTLGIEAPGREPDATLTTPEPIALHQAAGRARGGGGRASRHRGLEPRPRPAAARRAADRGRRLHQPRPRPLRLSWRHRGLSRGQAPAVRRRCSSRTVSPCSTRTSRSSRPWPRPPGRAACAVLDYGRQAGDLRLLRVAPAGSGQEIEIEALGRRHAFASRLVGSFQAHNLLAALGLAVAMRRGCRGSAAAFGSPPGAAGPDAARRSPPQRCSGLRRLLPQARGAGAGAALAAPAYGGPAAGGVRLRRRPRRRQAAADGRDRGAQRRPGLRHRRQPAHARTRPRSGARSWPRHRVRVEVGDREEAIRAGLRGASGRRRAARGRQGARDLPDRGRPRRCRSTMPRSCAAAALESGGTPA